jgi:DNA (cytosine-5)-methyltransferase 1
MITTGHLCSGYDGLGLALDLVEPHEAAFHAEIEPAPSRLLAREHPDVPNIGDFVQVLLDDLWGLAPYVDLLTAGFPCQPVSSAGRQLADLDHRWLWPFIVEIIRQRRPFRVFLENVQNLVSIQKGEIFRGILADLRAAGYAVRWTVMGACAVGAPHHRHRMFLVADLVGLDAPEAVRVGSKAICGAPRSGGRYLLPSPMARDGDGRGEGDDAYWSRRGETRTNGMPLGAAVALLPTPTTSNAHGNDVNGRGELLLPGIVGDPSVWGKFAEAVVLWESVTGVPAPEPTEPSSNGGRRLSPLLPEWMMGLLPGYLTKDATRSEALKMAGNGVVPLQAATAYRLLTS